MSMKISKMTIIAEEEIIKIIAAIGNVKIVMIKIL